MERAAMPVESLAAAGGDPDSAESFKLAGSRFGTMTADELRFRAEAALPGVRAEEAELSLDEARRLVHELQVHQIELQIQNEELREAQVALGQARDRYNELYDFAPVGYLTLDGNGRIVEANLTAATMLAIERGRLIGREFHRFVARDSRDALHLHQIAVSDHEQKVTSELQLRCNGHQPRTVLMESVRFVDLVAGKSLCQSVLIDITERKRLEDDLRQADRLKDEFLATLAHELRNPLAAIRSVLDAFRHGMLDPVHVQRFQGVLERQTDHLVHLVDDLLEISRITRGHIELKPGRYPLSELLAQALEMSRPLVEAKGHTVRLVNRTDPLNVDGDAVRLVQVFCNLLNNAAGYMEKGGDIQVTTERSGDEAIVRFSDRGIGIAPECLGQVFDLFHQANHLGDVSNRGLGIGLHLVEKLVGLHGGRVEACSEGLGRGSEFTVYLPLAAEPASRAWDGPMAAPGDLSGSRVLVVDDNHDAANSLGLLMESLGAAVKVAYDGESALASCIEFQPDAMLLDLGMPGLDGCEVARRVRRSADGKHIWLIAVTGWGQETDRVRSREAGFDEHLVKPVRVTELQALFARIRSGPPEASDAGA